MEEQDLKKCSCCGDFKPQHEFNKNKNKKDGLGIQCKQCRKEYNSRTKEQRNIRRKKFRQENKDRLCEIGKKYYRLNKNNKKEYDQIYYLDNKKNILDRHNKLAKEKRKDNPSFRIRGIVSQQIWKALKLNASSKEGESCLKYLGYTINDLKTHIENQFELWMTWENQGKYIKKDWDDQDQSTWTWQLDHIIPQSDLPYISMEDDNFKKCWALENLRPLSSKQNNFDGVNRVRHLKAA